MIYADLWPFIGKFGIFVVHKIQLGIVMRLCVYACLMLDSCVWVNNSQCTF